MPLADQQPRDSDLPDWAYDDGKLVAALCNVTRPFELHQLCVSAAFRIRELSSHLGVDASLDRIYEAHTATPVDQLMWPSGVQARAYKQSGHERCYICTLLDRIAKLEKELADVGK